MEALKVSEHVDNWNDDRLDALAKGVKDDFAKVDQRFDKVDERFEKVDQQFSAIRERLAGIESELKGLGKIESLIWRFGTGLLIAVVAPHLF
ncbi:MAG: hypothetical protein ACTHK6_12305 [Solirubrobacterales bacterium]